MSGGVLWIPNNPLMVAEGVDDSHEDAMAYFEDVVGDVGPSLYQRREAYITRWPEMVSFLQSLGLSFRRCEGYSDYYPDAKGGKARGRSIRGRSSTATASAHGSRSSSAASSSKCPVWPPTRADAAKLMNYNRSAKCLAASARSWIRTKSAFTTVKLP